MSRSIAYSDYLDDQLGLGRAETWGYLVWHLLMQGDLLISDSWFANNRGLWDLFRDRDALTLFEAGFARVACREGLELTEFVGKRLRTEAERPLLPRIAVLPRDRTLDWSLQTVGGRFTHYLRRCFLEDPIEAMDACAFTSGPLEIPGQLPDIAARVYERAAERSGGILLREHFKRALMDEQDLSARAALERMLDQTYRLNFALTCFQDLGAWPIVKDEFSGLCDFLTGRVPLLSNPFGAHRVWSGSLDYDVEPCDINDQDTRLPFLMAPTPAESLLLGQAVADAKQLRLLLEALEHSSARPRWLAARHGHSNARTWEEEANLYINRIEEAAIQTAPEVVQAVRSRAKLAYQKKKTGALLRVALGTASASLVVQAYPGVQVTELIAAITMVFGSLSIPGEVVERVVSPVFETREVAVSHELDTACERASSGAKSLITAIRRQTSMLRSPIRARAKKRGVMKRTPILRLLLHLFSDNTSLNVWIRLNFESVADDLPGNLEPSKNKYFREVVEVLATHALLNDALLDLLRREFPNSIDIINGIQLPVQWPSKTRQ